MATKKEKATTAAPARNISDLMSGDLVKAMLKKHGSRIVRVGSDVDDLAHLRIPTGIFQLDYALSGGLAVGRATIFFGPKSSSKSTTGLRALGNAQHLCGRCWTSNIHPSTGEEIKCKCGDYVQSVAALINTEQHFNKSWTQAVGVDLDRLVYVEPDYGEQAIDIAESLLGSGSVHFLMLDSLAFTVPSAEITKSVEEGMMGDHPRLLSRAIRKFLAAIGRCDREFGFKPTLLMTNQISYKIGVVYGSPETVPGGQRPGFMAATEVRFAPAKAESEDDAEGAESIEIRFKVTKQKTGRPYREGEYKLLFKANEYKSKADVEDEDKVIDLARKIGTMGGSGGNWQVLGEKFAKIEDVKARMLTDAAFDVVFRKTTMTALLKADE